MSQRWRTAREAVDLVLPPILMAWVAFIAWVVHTHYLVEWHQGTAANDIKCAALASWLQNHGGTVYGLECTKTPGAGRGIVATTALRDGELVIAVPRPLWITEWNLQRNTQVAQALAKDAVLIRVLGKQWGGRGAPWRMIAALDSERTNTSSFWRTYIDALPEDQPSTLWWDDATVASLQSEVLSRQINANQKKIRAMYDEVYPHLLSTYPQFFRSDQHNFSTFVNAAVHVWSRAFDAKVEPWNPKSRKTWALVPFVDLANHDSSVRFTFNEAVPRERQDDRVKFEVTSGFCLTPKSEFHINYGKKSTTEFLLIYGFLPRYDYRSDFIAVTLPQSISKRITAAPENNWRGGFVGTDGHLTEPFLAMYARILHKNETGFNDGADSSVSFRRAINLILQSAMMAESLFPTTLAEDELSLSNAGEGISAAVRTSLEVRVRFKRLLVAFIANLKHRVSATDPTSNTSWLLPKHPESAVYDPSIVAYRRLQRNIDKSLYTIALPDL